MHEEIFPEKEEEMTSVLVTGGGSKGRPKTVEHKRKLSIAMTGKRYTPEINKKKGRPGMLNPFWGHHHTDEVKARLRQICPKYGNTPEVNKKKALQGKRNPFYGKHHSEATRKKMSEQKRKLCQEGEYLKKIMIARDLKPNKSELALTDILNRHFPGEWKYIGDGKDGTSIGGKVPDWLNVNGYKAVIELFSDYWHSRPGQSGTRTRDGMLKHYASYGFKCLIIDWKEVKDPIRLIPKIADFRRSL